MMGKATSPSSARPEPVEGPPLSLNVGAMEGQPFDRLRANGVRGKLTADAPLAPLVWFKSGGSAQWLFEPKDLGDLQAFLRGLDPTVPVMALGLGSNLIVRDGGVPGVVVRLGKAFSWADTVGKGTFGIDDVLNCGGGASGILVSSMARDHGIAGLEFLRSIPGTVGGFVRMNGGAYGSEVKDVLIDCDVVLRGGELVTLPVADLRYTYRHSNLPEGAIVVAARFRGRPGQPAEIQAEMDRISASREASQPLRSKTGGSTFKNPEGHKAWQLVDAAGCRGLTLGGAQVSEKHTNFLINTGSATSTEIEALGEEVRRRVKEKSGVELEWEIQRVGIIAGAPDNEGVGIIAGAPDNEGFGKQ
jgi:UDP-N-acetylmuramate dehydrogenase